MAGVARWTPMPPGRRLLRTRAAWDVGCWTWGPSRAPSASPCCRTTTGSRPAPPATDTADDGKKVRLWSANLGYQPLKPGLAVPAGTRVVLWSDTDDGSDANHQGGEHAHGSSGPPTPVSGRWPHPLLRAAGGLQRLLMDTGGEAANPVAPTAVANPAAPTLVVDVSALLVEAAASKAGLAGQLELESCSRAALTKQLGRPLARVLGKLPLRDATVVAGGELCQILLKLLVVDGNRGLTERAGAIARVVLYHPVLPAAAVNGLLGGLPPSAAALPGWPALDAVFPTAGLLRKRDPMLRGVFPRGRSVVAQLGPAMLLPVLVELALCGTVPSASAPTPAAATSPARGRGNTRSEPGTPTPDPGTPTRRDDAAGSGNTADGAGYGDGDVVSGADDGEDDTSEDGASAYDPSLHDTLGRVLCLAELEVVMNKYSKQDVQLVHELTADLARQLADPSLRPGAQPASGGGGGGGAIDPLGANATEVGIVILRGNRCILARSLGGLDAPKVWGGVRVPTAVPAPGEAPHATAVRAAEECCEIEADGEVIPVDAIPVLRLYRGATHVTHIHVFYTLSGSEAPQSAAAAATAEDEDEPYDWFTFARAMEVAEPRTRELLQTLAYALRAAAVAGRVPDKWGGVFGQEFAGRA